MFRSEEVFNYMNSFTHRRIHPSVIQIIDHDVYMFLIEGTEKSVLIDTGYGIGNIREYVRTLTDRKVTVLLTHNHSDHSGGIGWFENVYLNRRDWKGCFGCQTIEKRYERLSRKKDFADIPKEDYAPQFQGALQELSEGDEFDLGGITLKVIEVPGHSFGSVMFLLKEERIIIYGDACGRRLGLLSPGHYVSDYLKALEHLKEYDGTYDLIWRSHNELECPLDVLDDDIECCREILNGTDDHFEVLRHGRKCFAAKAVDLTDKYEKRLDGKTGNIYYIPENAE